MGNINQTELIPVTDYFHVGTGKSEAFSSADSIRAPLLLPGSGFARLSLATFPVVDDDAGFGASMPE
jgi:hypothetical protein